MEKVTTREDQAEVESSNGTSKEQATPVAAKAEEAQNIHAKTLILLAVRSRARIISDDSSKLSCVAGHCGRLRSSASMRVVSGRLSTFCPGYTVSVQQ
jgi:hypothetical protein